MKWDSVGEMCYCYQMEMPCFHVEGLGDLQKMGNLFLMLLCDPVWFITTNLLILALIHMP